MKQSLALIVLVGSFIHVQAAEEEKENKMLAAKEKSALNELVTLPSADVINKRLCDKGLEHFAERTKLGKQLGGQKTYPIGVATAVELAVGDYVKNQAVSVIMQRRKKEIVECILLDHPKALADLNKQLSDAGIDSAD